MNKQKMPSILELMAFAPQTGLNSNHLVEQLKILNELRIP
jgi:hypothetical protein